MFKKGLKLISTVLRYFLSRALIVFVLIVLFSTIFVDYNKIKSGAKIRSMYYLKASSFDPFIDLLVHGKKIERKKIEEYLFFYEKAVEYMPGNADAYSLMGCCYFHLKQFKKSEEAFKEAIYANGKIFWFYHNLAVVYFEKNEYQNAIKVLRKAVGKNPNDNVQFFDSARRFYHPILKASGFDSNDLRNRLKIGYRECYLMLYLCYQRLGNMQEAQKIWKLAEKANIADFSNVYEKENLNEFQHFKVKAF